MHTATRKLIFSSHDNHLEATVGLEVWESTHPRTILLAMGYTTKSFDV